MGEGCVRPRRCDKADVIGGAVAVAVAAPTGGFCVIAGAAEAVGEAALVGEAELYIVYRSRDSTSHGGSDPPIGGRMVSRSRAVTREYISAWPSEAGGKRMGASNVHCAERGKEADLANAHKWRIVQRKRCHSVGARASSSFSKVGSARSRKAAGRRGP